ncbi:uncharacterized protein [Phyllobates terribilis]|uniref:uncharacterized protein n=1 Tax=Phyllobates terribilis TaxID=111132 RepID=UPI003CCAE2F3
MNWIRLILLSDLQIISIKATRDASGHLFPFTFSRRATGDLDVSFKILYSGICHSDFHYIKNEWHNAVYPAIPGYARDVGEIIEVRNKVTKFKVGDKVGVGCMVGSCRSCDNCTDHLENYCPNLILTYEGYYHDGTLTYGGYSDIMVVHEHFAIRIPEGIPLESAAPLLCAGITVYSPLKYYGLDSPGLHLGVVGLGGLGHMAVKFGKALGLKVTVISTSLGKRDEAICRLGADSFLLSSDPAQMKVLPRTLDGITDTISGNHPLPSLISLLKSHGKLVIVGAPEKPYEVPSFSLIQGRKLVGGSMIRGTQEMMDFVVEKGVKADVEVISIYYVNIAMARMLKSDIKYRLVINIANTLKAD